MCTCPHVLFELLNFGDTVSKKDHISALSSSYIDVNLLKLKQRLSTLE